MDTINTCEKQLSQTRCIIAKIIVREKTESKKEEVLGIIDRIKLNLAVFFEGTERGRFCPFGPMQASLFRFLGDRVYRFSVRLRTTTDHPDANLSPAVHFGSSLGSSRPDDVLPSSAGNRCSPRRADPAQLCTSHIAVCGQIQYRI